ncbi:PilZ domain-containing protein [Trichloromonas sp.]|uniref:PilZ domain-containing protein n=1 Tax=Trichloromonas sp. TaxID=3069249 RepID=UPI002A3C5B03|nr:PilZ domain-containing protein [Trichloromonas sp.]
MKRLLLGDTRQPLLETIEGMLKHWGYRVLVSSRPEQIRVLLQETSPDLLILGAGLLANAESALRQGVDKQLAAGNCPLLVLGEEGVEVDPTLPHEAISVPIDLFSFFAQVQRHTERFPRKNLRLTVKLPGMFARGAQTFLAEVLSLSIQGLMIKTSLRMEPGDLLTVCIPLVGMSKELELAGRVLYSVHPSPDNNYMQGVGVEFIDLNEADRKALGEFIRKRFFGGVSTEEHAPQVFPDQFEPPP